MSENGYSVLIVDDNPDHRDLLKRMLSRAPSNWQIQEASCLRTAVAQIEACTPDLVLADYRLPGGNGLHLVDRIQQISASTRPAVVVLTSHKDARIATHALRCGAQDFLVKSEISPRELDEKLNDALTRVAWIRSQAERLKTLRQADRDFDLLLEILAGGQAEVLRRLQDQIDAMAGSYTGGSLGSVAVSADAISPALPRTSDSNTMVAADAPGSDSIAQLQSNLEEQIAINRQAVDLVERLRTRLYGSVR